MAIRCPGPGVAGDCELPAMSGRHRTQLFAALRGSKRPSLLSHLCSPALPMLSRLSPRHSAEYDPDPPLGFFFLSFFNVMKRQLLYQYLNSTRLLKVRSCYHLCSLKIKSQFQMCPFSFPKSFIKSLLREKKALTSSSK